MMRLLALTAVSIQRCNDRCSVDRVIYKRRGCLASFKVQHDEDIRCTIHRLESSFCGRCKNLKKFLRCRRFEATRVGWTSGIEVPIPLFFARLRCCSKVRRGSVPQAMWLSDAGLGS